MHRLTRKLLPAGRPKCKREGVAEDRFGSLASILSYPLHVRLPADLGHRSRQGQSRAGHERVVVAVIKFLAVSRSLWLSGVFSRNRLAHVVSQLAIMQSESQV